jgi:hypothetical protein
MKLTVEDISNIDTNAAAEAVGKLKSIVESMRFSDPYDVPKWNHLFCQAAEAMNGIADNLRLMPPDVTEGRKKHKALHDAIAAQKCDHCEFYFGERGPQHHCEICKPVRLALAGSTS